MTVETTPPSPVSGGTVGSPLPAHPLGDEQRSRPAKKEPKRRADGRCALKSCRKKLRPVTKAMRKYAGEQIDQDGFCSTKCCREYFGTTEPISPFHSGEYPERIPPYRSHEKETAMRRAYREKHRVPCEDCGTPVEGKGRGTRPGMDPNRPYLCVRCCLARRKAA